MAHGICLISDCNNLQHSRGWCTKHYLRWYHHGDVHYEPSRPKPKLKKKPRQPSTSYQAVHKQVQRQRGKASNHQCQHCDSAAEHWAYDHADPDPLTAIKRGRVVVYSFDPARYLPLCRRCHALFDRERNSGVRILNWA